MEVLVVESPIVTKWENMFTRMCEMHESALEENKKLKEKQWLSAQEVADLTPYKPATILARKSEIGFKQDGKNVIFYKPDVMAWVARDYNPPRALKVVQRHIK